jgi:hypothetical protein
MMSGNCSRGTTLWVSRYDVVFGAEHSFVEHDEFAVAGEAVRDHADGVDL